VLIGVSLLVWHQRIFPDDAMPLGKPAYAIRTAHRRVTGVPSWWTSGFAMAKWPSYFLYTLLVMGIYNRYNAKGERTVPGPFDKMVCLVDEAYILDLIANADRRAKIEGKYEDAVAQPYSCFERDAKFRLQRQYGMSTDDVRVDQFPEVLRSQFEQKYRDPRDAKIG
jgi:hypothetical protein